MVSVYFLMSLIIASALAVKVPLTMLTNEKAKCLDGSQAGFYFQSAPKLEDKSKWVIYLNGGGECDSESACIYQTGSALGSSKYFAAEADPSGWYLASDYCPNNPQFCGWNHVEDPYCTQDLHSGQVTAPDNSTWGLYFSGHLVLVAILDELDNASNSLIDATDIIVHGCSAGGIGVWMNVDYIAKRYPNARVSAATVAGHYFYATYYTGPNQTAESGMGDFRESAMPTTYELYDAYVDETCKEAMLGEGKSPSACMMSSYALPYIESDSFVIQAMTDSVVLTGHDTWPEAYMYEEPEQAFMKEWYSNMTAALQPFLSEDQQGSPRRGAFGAACYIHGGFTHSYPIVHEMTFYEAFANFYFNWTGPEGYKVADECGAMCNPTCYGVV